MNWLVTIIIGGIVGWVGSKLMHTDAQMGLLANVVVGIVGAMIGFWIAGALGLAASGPILSWVVAIVGAMVLIWILKVLGVFK
ncbi:MAG: GlsB/YeaQ/YmgE family stress response membrane protein [Gemmatimonadota bacterium]|jgi:uncharacterized membrane protein YeaQ/YmgE (transglycosylase-associated protein family)